MMRLDNFRFCLALLFLGTVLASGAPGSAAADGSMMASTFFGGAGDEANIKSVFVAGNGDIWIAGQTSSGDLPCTPGAYDSTYNGGDGDIFVARLSGDLGTLLACTYIGGTGFDGDYSGPVLVVDGAGDVYVAGHTESSDWPVTPGAFDTAYHAGSDGFIAKLNGGLTNLIASSYFGGNGRDFIEAIVIDEEGRTYVTGTTCSSDFPATSGAYDETHNGGSSMWGDVFIARFDADLSNLGAATLIGGSGGESGGAVALDGEGHIYVCGYTWSNDYPYTTGAYDTAAALGSDLLLSKLDTALTMLVASTYIGGASDEYGLAMAIGADGSIFLSGHTASTDFPVTEGVIDTSYSSVFGAGIGDDAYVSRLSADLSTLIASTYLGGRRWDSTNSMVIGENGDVYLAGSGRSPNFPITPGAYDDVYSDGTSEWGREGFLSRLSPDLTTLRASTFLGEEGNEWLSAVALDGDGNLVVAGATSSPGFPVTAGSYDESYNGGLAGDAIICLFDTLLAAASTGVGSLGAPERTRLHANAPNPFNPSTTIRFELAGDATVRLAVHDLRGRQVRLLHGGPLPAGPHSFRWDGRDRDRCPVSSGVYFSVLETEEGTRSNKMLLIR